MFYFCLSFGVDLFVLLEVLSRLMFAIRLKCSSLDYLVYLASVQKHGTLQHLHSIHFAEKFVPLILELPQEDDGVDVLIAASF